MSALFSVTSTSAATATGSWANLDEMSLTVTGTTAGDCILLTFSMSPLMTSTDAAAQFRFARGGTAIGPEIPLGGSDTTNEGMGGTLMFVDTGHSGGSVSYTVQWIDVTGTLDTDTSRIRSFQAVHFPAADANLLVNVSSTGAYTFTGSYADITGMSSTQTVGSTSDVLVFIGTCPVNEGAVSVDFRFADGGTREGPELTAAGGQSSTLFCESSMAWAKTGISGSHTFSMQGTTRLGSPTAETTRTRYFQVLEVNRGALVLSLTGTGQNNAPGTYADVPSLSGALTTSVTTNSVLWMLSHAQIELTGTDETADFRFAQGGTREGPEVTCGFGDNTNNWCGSSLSWCKTGVTGTPTMSIQWQARAATAVTDNTRTRTIQVIELQTQTYKLEGVTRDDALAALANVRCVLLKHDGAAEASRVYSIIDHVNSDGSGNYSFTGISDNDARYCVVAVDQGTPIVRGATDDDLQPVAE